MLSTLAKKASKPISQVFAIVRSGIVTGDLLLFAILLSCQTAHANVIGSVYEEVAHALRTGDRENLVLMARLQSEQTGFVGLAPRGAIDRFLTPDARRYFVMVEGTTVLAERRFPDYEVFLRTKVMRTPSTHSAPAPQAQLGLEFIVKARGYASFSMYRRQISERLPGNLLNQDVIRMPSTKKTRAMIGIIASVFDDYVIEADRNLLTKRHELFLVRGETSAGEASFSIESVTLPPSVASKLDPKVINSIVQALAEAAP